jgi:hypothetical protein
VAGTVQVVDGTQGANKVLTSDATGLASWQTPTAAPQYFDWLKTGDALPTTAGDNSVNIYHVGGNVGIGTNAPGTKLDIYNSTTGADIGDDYRFRDESPISNLQSISFDRSNAGNNLASGNVIGVLDFNAKAGGSFVSSTRIQSTYRGNGTNNLSDMIFNVSGNSNEAMRITEALKVGIGTASPSGKLTVSGNGGGVTPILSLTNTNVAGNPTLNIYPGYTSTVTSIAEGNQFAVVFDQDPGQGTAGANQSLYDFHGQVRYQTASALSDRRLKENIYDMKQYGLKEILKMQPRNYTMKASKTKDIGFIAQELKQIVPELVMGQETENSLLSVDYSKVCLVLINAIKEQQAQIEALKTANTGLKAEVSKVAQLSDELNVLKASIEKLTNAQKPELVSAK